MRDRVALTWRRLGWVAAILGAVGLAAATLGTEHGREPTGEDAPPTATGGDAPTYAAYRRAVGGVPPRPHQPAVHHRAGTWLPASDPGRFEGLPVADPVALGEQEAGWDPLLQWLVGVPVPNPGSIGRMHCAITVLSGVLDGACQVDLRLFLERREDRATGRIVGVAPSEPGGPAVGACAEYVRCIEPTLLGASVDWPEPVAGDELLVVRYQQVVAAPPDDPATMRARIENSLPLLRRTLGEISVDTPEGRTARAQLEDLIDYYEWLLAQTEP